MQYISHPHGSYLRCWKKTFVTFKFYLTIKKMQFAEHTLDDSEYKLTNFVFPLELFEDTGWSGFDAGLPNPGGADPECLMGGGGGFEPGSGTAGDPSLELELRDEEVCLGLAPVEAALLS